MPTTLPLRARPLPALLLVVLVTASTTPVAGSTARPAQRWLPPVAPTVVVRAFDPPAQAWLAGHRGIDLRARPGAMVRAAGAGRVVFASTLAGRGVLVIDHGEVRTTYEPVAADVAVGQRVRVGQAVGRITRGTGHCGDGTCLHLGLRRGRTYLDPHLLLARGRAVLRPW